MSIIKKLRRTLAASLMLAAGHFTPATAQSTTDVWFCNNTGSDVFIELRPVFRTVCLLTLRGHFPSHIFESLFWRFVADA